MSDLISRQAAIDAVKFGITNAKAFNKSTGEVKELFKEGNKALNEAAERLKELPSIQPQWIPCSERLPKVGDTYIVTGKQKWSNQKEWEYFTDAAIYEPVGAYIDDCWTTWNDWIEGQETHIIAWMEMPEPWKEEEE